MTNRDKKMLIQMTIFDILAFAKITSPFMREEGKMLPCITSSLFVFTKGERMRESDFQSSLKRELRNTFEGCMVVKLDPSFKQGIPDLLILYGDRWASLECKKNAKAKRRPNQRLYVDRMDQMSFSRFIYPENKEEVINELRQYFKPGGSSRDI